MATATATATKRAEAAKRRGRRYWKEKYELKMARESLKQLEETAAKKRAGINRLRRQAIRSEARLMKRAELDLEAASRAHRIASERNQWGNICIDLGLASLDAHDRGDTAMAADLDRALRELMMPPPS